MKDGGRVSGSGGRKSAKGSRGGQSERASAADDNASAKPPTKPFQVRLPAPEIEAFHELAYEEFGMRHGAKTDLFRLMWEAYEERRADEGRPVKRTHRRAMLDKLQGG